MPKLITFINRERTSTVAEKAQLAGTSRERRQGLMGVEAFDQVSGLWIVPCEAIHTFGMKMAIDSIFLDRQMRVRGLRANLQPWRIAVCLRAHSVLEVPAGTIANSGTQLGDHLEAVGVSG